MYLKLINKPELFQGRKKKDEYFEGWYFKHTSTAGNIISFIPGISLIKNQEHSFIQVIYNEGGLKEDSVLKSYYIPFELEAFSYQDNPFKITIGNNEFTLEGCSLNIYKENLRLESKFIYKEKIKINKNIIKPNIMGCFAYIPFMECYHGVLSMDHQVEGFVKIDDLRLEFKKGRGYIEKDWGTSFPSKYIWIQGNDFESAKTSLFFSLAKIPFINNSFTGHICVFVHKEREYRFATYNFSRIRKFDLEKEEVKIQLSNNCYELEIIAKLSPKGGLKAPIKGKMENIIKEGLGGEVLVRLTREKKTLFYGKSQNVGIEIVGMEK